MIGLLQRVTTGSVTVDEQVIGQIETGIVVLVGFQAQDEESKIPRFVERVSGFRIFSDKSGKMNLSVADKGGSILWVPQFTLAADTNSGRRPSFQTAAEPSRARVMFEQLKHEAITQHPASQFGEFGAHMQVQINNNGPVTFWIEL